MNNPLRKPWTLSQSLMYPSLHCVHNCDGDVIATDKTWEVGKLIEAAPDLAEQCDRLIDALKVAEQTLRNLGQGYLRGAAQTIAHNAATRIRTVLE